MSWCFLRLLGKAAGQNYKVFAVYKAEEPESVASELGPNFPKLGAYQFLEIPGRRPWESANQIKHPGNLLSLLSIEGFKEVLNRASSRMMLVEPDRPHFKKLAYVRTLSRVHLASTRQDFDPATGTGLSGETVTRWQYNSAGLLQQKHYNDGGTSQPGPLHTYTPGGRPATKTLPRDGDDDQPIVITYLYADGTAGQPHTIRLTGIDYGSNTPETASVIYTHDNRGRVRTIEDGSGRRRLTYQAGRIVSDLYETGPLAGYGHTQTLDPQNGYRPSARSALKPNNGTLQSEALAFDDFGRIEALTIGQELF